MLESLSHILHPHPNTAVENTRLIFTFHSYTYRFIHLPFLYFLQFAALFIFNHQYTTPYSYNTGDSAACPYPAFLL